MPTILSCITRQDLSAPPAGLPLVLRESSARRRLVSLGPSTCGEFQSGNNPGFFEPFLDVAVAALDPSETTVAYCPRFFPLPPMLIFVNGGRGS